MALRGKRVLIDFETRSIAKLGSKDSVGAHKYAEHPSTTILCMGYLLPDEEEPSIWWPFYGEPMPDIIKKAVEDGWMFEAHNAGFERAIWKTIIERDYDVPLPKNWHDTMAACAYRSLPLSLDDATEVLNLAHKKDKRGKQLLRKLCQPQKLTKKDIKEGKEWPNWCDDAALMEELGEYCKQDVRAEHALSKAIRDLPEDEYEVWCMDQEINDLGVYVDIGAVEAADKIRADVEVKLEAELGKVTGGAVNSGSELAKMLEWIAPRANNLGIFIDNLQAETVEEWIKKLKDDTDEDASAIHRVLQIRQTLSKASAKKLAKFISMRCDDGRIRGLLQYHGAGTGRWAGRGLQPQNFPRPDEKLVKDQKGEPHGAAMERLVEAIRSADPDLVELLYGDPMAAIASGLRGLITAAPGKELYVADFSAIEARVLAWVAGEQWKLDAFAGIDRGEGYKGSKDIYLATASGVFGYPCLTKETHGVERQTGKTCELAFGYQGGVGAWRKFDDSDKWTDDEVNEKKNQWRASHPNVVELWYGLEEAAVQAVLTGRAHKYMSITYQVVNSSCGKWLACKLPNNRCLWYYNPRLEQNRMPWQKPGEWKYQVVYEGRDSKKGGAWNDIRTYGGMLTENVVQAISRDLMVEAMFRVRKADYPIVLTIHDEIIGERDKGTGGDFGEFSRLMAIVPDWIPGIPIAVSGYRAERYRKD